MHVNVSESLGSNFSGRACDSVVVESEVDDSDGEADGGGGTTGSFVVGFEAEEVEVEGACNDEAFVPNGLEVLGMLPGMTPKRRRS